MSCNQDHTATDAGILATPCPKVSCKARAGEPCRTFQGKPLTYGGHRDRHQARLDAYWQRQKASGAIRLPDTAGEQGAVLE